MRLLFIDDEEETRRGIEKNVNWEKLRIHSVVSFSNPFAALSCLEKEPVDIVLSDIRIPQMDGIELCRRILQRNPSVSIIFISGYSDKEYLMNAIQLSAVDYIEKPVSVPKLEDAIARAVDRQLHARTLRQQQKSAVEILQKNRQMFLDQLMQKLIRSPLTLSEKDRELFPLDGSHFYRIYLVSARPGTLRFQNLQKTLEAALADSGLAPAFFSSRKDEDTFLFLLCFSSPQACDSLGIDQLLLQLLRWEHMKEFVCCAYGQLLQGAQCIAESFRQAATALQGIFFQGYGTVLPYLPPGKGGQPGHAAGHGTQPEPARNPAQGYELPPLSRLMEGLQAHDQPLCVSYLEDVYALFRKRTCILPDKVKNDYFQILSAINQAALERGKPAHEPNAPTDYLWQRINTLRTLEECHLYALEKTEQLFHNLADMLSERKIILDIIRIIQGQYQDSTLYINTIAEQVYMTPNYLSMLFKKETGKTIGTYITEYRMKQSANLLTQTNMKLYDIAQAVGYTDTNYYSRIFKKHYHMTPSEYRNHLP